MNKKRKKKLKKRIFKFVFFTVLAVFLVSSGLTIFTLQRNRVEQKAFDDIAKQYETSKEQTPVAEIEENDDSSEVLPGFDVLHSLNNDLFGWIKIEGTVVNYPVMYTPEDPEYYLHRAFDESYSYNGTIFMNAKCYEGCKNYILYGHHMNNGMMFATVAKYASYDFYLNHRIIEFDTLRGEGEYEVLGAFYSKVFKGKEEGFRYYSFTDLSDREDFEKYVSLVKESSIYETGVYAEYTDELITLSTCNLHTEDGRFVVVAKKIK